MTRKSHWHNSGFAVGKGLKNTFTTFAFYFYLRWTYYKKALTFKNYLNRFCTFDCSYLRTSLLFCCSKKLLINLDNKSGFLGNDLRV